LNIVLARWLEPADYGAYAVGFSVFLFLSGFHNSLILEPMSVLGASRRGSGLPSYLGQLVKLHAGLMLATALLLIAASLVVPDAALAGALRALALAAPMVLLFWLFRRSYYLEAGPLPAVLTSTIYGACMLLAAAALWRIGWLSGPTGLLTMGLGGAMASAWGWARVGVQLTSAETTARDSADIRSTIATHWKYGRWIAAQSLLAVGSTYIQTFLTAGLLGLDAAGTLRAMEIFTLPMTQILTAVGVLTLPILSAEYLAGGAAGLRRKGLWVILVLVGLAAAYEIALLELAAPVEHLIYGGKFAAYTWLIPLQGLVPLFMAVAQGYSLNLRALQKPQHYLIVSVATTPVGLGSAVLLIQAWGIRGSAVSSILTAATFALAHYCLYRLWMPAARSGGRKPETLA